MTPSGPMSIDDGSDVNTSRSYLASPARRSNCSTSRVTLLVIVTSALTLTAGLLLGRFAIPRDDDDESGVFLPGAPERLMESGDSDVAQKILDGIEAGKIEENLRLITAKPHIAGRQADFELVDLLKARFQEYGLQVQVTPYDVLLSYPSDTVPNSVRLLDGDREVIYDAVADESDLSEQPGVVRAFHAYSPAGLVEAPLVFAGYGRVEDFDWLRSQNINVTGHVVIVKYGKMFRGDKVDIAHANGALGVIMYADPAEYTGMGSGDTRVYPDTWWLPPDGVQRGTIFTGDGDPLTPGYPANNLAYRPNEADVKLPKIPSHPIGYGAAEKIMKHLGGMEVPGDSDWQGGMNITYRTGPGFLNTSWRIQLNVTSHNQRAKAENVIGIIKGEIEPDRYVLLGNHRDAWIYGALDPSTGTAAMLEIARVMGKLVQTGEWKPRRSIMFCSWGAEEYALAGSTEWVEQYVATLRERAVAYINMDTAVVGNDTLRLGAVPLMHKVAYEAAKKVENPNPAERAAGRTSVYDTWLHIEPWKDDNGQSKGVPRIDDLGSGSDFAPLLQKVGIPALDLWYSFDPALYNVQWFALYHTEYEVFDIYKSQFDRDFKCLQAVARVSAEVTRSLADSLLLPLGLSDYSQGLHDILHTLDNDYGAVLRKNLLNFGLELSS
ncbi:N-acetylated-alpha-linked acidic dipeptidase 2 [Plakobranchus ocellatus]|uniref:N-acetylated-alpha-linked acidic dipeptidase 2 n=1 Tax=Plakobranchus ocellatus TaxID=259542 RepID=A0AAV4DYC0_9GAST|nr:N-acetylated-alpha-linked acidic dipeptidase 2 [Plakobranchus ocellatus]